MKRIKNSVWLVGITALYVVLALVNFFWPFTLLEYLQAAWILLLAAPLYLPLDRWIAIKSIWTIR